MINQLLGKVFGTKNERVIKALMPKIQAINALEPQMQKLTDAELRAKTDAFRSGWVASSERPNPVSSNLEPGRSLILTSKKSLKNKNIKFFRKF